MTASRTRLPPAVFLLLPLITGCGTPPNVLTVSGEQPSRWREVHGAISPEIDELLRGSGIRIVSVWYVAAELRAVLDLSSNHHLDKGWTVLVGHGTSVLATISIVEVDGRSAIGVVTLSVPDEPVAPLKLTLAPVPSGRSRSGDTPRNLTLAG